MFAVTGGSPAASSAGYDTSEANPAMEPMSPAPTPATSRKINTLGPMITITQSHRPPGRPGYRPLVFVIYDRP